MGPVTETVTVTGGRPSRRRPQREARGDARRATSCDAIPTVRSYNALLPLIPGVVDQRQRHGHRAVGDRDVLSDSRRPDQRGTADAGRPDDRQPAERQLRGQLRRRRRQRAGSDVHDGGRARRVGNRRPGDEHRAEERRQHDARLALRERHRRDVPVEQPHAGARSSRAVRGDAADQGLRLLGHARRSDRPRSRLVLRQRAHRRQHARERRPCTTT